MKLAKQIAKTVAESALVKTAEYRYPRPSPVEEFIFYDHPSVERRVHRAMEWKAAHPEPPTS